MFSITLLANSCIVEDSNHSNVRDWSKFIYMQHPNSTDCFCGVGFDEIDEQNLTVDLTSGTDDVIFTRTDCHSIQKGTPIYTIEADRDINWSKFIFMKHANTMDCFCGLGFAEIDGQNLTVDATSGTDDVVFTKTNCDAIQKGTPIYTLIAN